MQGEQKTIHIGQLYSPNISGIILIITPFSSGGGTGINLNTFLGNDM